jgi:predicted SprT family Zn-dependent metalloprotease
MDKTFVPDASWMAQKYDEMNAMLFNGKLGACEFGIFTTGRGSGGGVLGWFEMRGANLKADRYNRRMFADTFAGKEYINKDNFVEICKPKIELNGNYRGTEHGFLCTLVHEMCHYYTYMNGWAPTQAHGREFRDIGMVVASRSNGLFTVQRLASAEQMSEMELNDEMKAKKEKRLVSKKASMSAVVVFMPDGSIQLTTTSSQPLIGKIKFYRGSDDKTGTILDKKYWPTVVVSNNPEVIDFLFSKGYRTNMRTWQYWNIEGKPWIEEFKRMLNGEASIQNVPQSDNSETKTPSKVFSVKTTNGVFVCDADDMYELVSKIKRRFPKMSDETIEKVVSNPANYKTVMNESKVRIKRIVREVIEEYLNNESLDDMDAENVVSIKPGMNLGLVSPLQM